MGLTALLLAGLAAGSVHVVSGPDHLAAVLPLAVERRRRAAAVGAWWGVGHGAGVLALGALGQLLKERIDVEALSGASEVMVGVLLVALGAWTLWRSRLVVVHAHEHPHPGAPPDASGHRHLHVHVADPTAHAPDHPRRGRHGRHHHSAFGFGVLHGTAGAGHLLGVLPSLALGPGAAAVYLSAYFLAAVAAMTTFALVAGRAVRRPASVPLALRLSGVATLAVGLAWVGMAVA